MPPQNERLQQLMILWLAIVSSVIMYGVIAWIAIESNPDTTTERLYGFVSNPVSFALAIAALGAFFASFIIPARIIRRRRETTRRTAPAAPSAFEVAPEIFTALIVRYALLEAPAVIGLAGAFLMQEWRFYLPFAILAFLGLVLTAPTAALVRSLDEANR